MDINHAFARQLRDPTGAGGRAVGRLMRLLNARPNSLAVEALDLQPADRILELGCGPGHALELMAARAPLGVVHGIDQSMAMLEQSQSRNRKAIRAGRVRLCRGRFEALPFPSRSMDKVLAVNVAYFWRDAGAVLNEVRRVLRPGGRLSIYVTDASTMRRWKFIDSDTHLLFDREGLADALRQGGLSDDRITFTEIPLPGRITGLIATASTPRNPVSAH